MKGGRDEKEEERGRGREKEKEREKGERERKRKREREREIIVNPQIPQARGKCLSPKICHNGK